MSTQIEMTVTLYEDQKAWLEKVIAEQDIEDVSKALRILLDYAQQEGDEQTIFGMENMRCLHC